MARGEVVEVPREKVRAKVVGRRVVAVSKRGALTAPVVRMVTVNAGPIRAALRSIASAGGALGKSTPRQKDGPANGRRIVCDALGRWVLLPEGGARPSARYAKMDDDKLRGEAIRAMRELQRLQEAMAK